MSQDQIEILAAHEANTIMQEIDFHRFAQGEQIMRQVTFKIYTIDEHPNPEACYNWIRNNWYDLGQHIIDDMIASLKALADYTGGKLDYSIGIFPDRGEFVKLTDYNKNALTDLMDKIDNCPLTGVCYDFNVIEGLACDELEHQVLKALHAEGEYIYSDEGLQQLCEANGYEFKENGQVA